MAELARIVSVIAGQSAPADELLATLADCQHGVVARWELMQLGLSADQVQGRVERGRLHRIHRGVYAVGRRRITLRGRWMAAVLACGEDAVLSHRPALALWDLRKAPYGNVDVTDPHRARDGQPGLRLHSARNLRPDDVTVIDGIPVTSLPRTLLDCAPGMGAQSLLQVLEETERREILDGRELNALVTRATGHRGVKPLRKAIAARAGSPPWTQSELEARFLALVRAAGLPEPQANVVVAGEVVDFYWPAHGLVAEVDGYAFHKTRATFESDRRKDTRFQLADLRVIRPTQRRIEHEPGQLAADVARLLNAGPADAAA